MKEAESVQIASELVGALRSARRVIAVTGAGVSAESGIPTFRDSDGIWARFDPAEVATPQAFARDPARVWGWYAFRRRAMAGARPNAAHVALARMERQVPEFKLVTQNIDGLHARAGSSKLIELHGNIERSRCFDCGVHAKIFEQQQEPVAGEEPRREDPPRCNACGGLMRPDIVWFGETLDEETLRNAFEAAEEADLLLSIGTSGLVEPAASLAYAALEATAVVVEVNTEATPLSDWAHHVLRLPAGQALPALVEATWPGNDERRD